MATSNDIRNAVTAINNALAANNPKGLTDVLRAEGIVSDGRFDILSYDALVRVLQETYLTDPAKWGEIMKSVPFNYQKTDSSTSPRTREQFEIISASLDSSGEVQKTKAGGFFDKALELLLGSTTTTTGGYAPTQLKAKASPWVYVAFTVLGLALLGLIIFAIKKA